ncbi:hypothetical protein SCP_0805600 [Sparassis crispa]|uniref:Uncharacterized protein n=1 Tax=Sparassis crispa TaxID=139825 RepID=A0A401GV10_9APHY|nr:hypothetical protein SCP_0805600 [Sparassis crispa]GBE86036.1 hypothetical protein SCP_0805600 [Sparassis crispa]
MSLASARLSAPRPCSARDRVLSRRALALSRSLGQGGRKMRLEGHGGPGTPTQIDAQRHGPEQVSPVSPRRLPLARAQTPDAAMRTLAPRRVDSLHPPRACSRRAISRRSVEARPGTAAVEAAGRERNAAGRRTLPQREPLLTRRRPAAKIVITPKKKKEKKEKTSKVESRRHGPGSLSQTRACGTPTRTMRKSPYASRRREAHARARETPPLRFTVIVNPCETSLVSSRHDAPYARTYEAGPGGRAAEVGLGMLLPPSPPPSLPCRQESRLLMDARGDYLRAGQRSRVALRSAPIGSARIGLPQRQQYCQLAHGSPTLQCEFLHASVRGPNSRPNMYSGENHNYTKYYFQDLYTPTPTNRTDRKRNRDK